MLYTVATIAFSLWVIRNTLFWVSLWQTKEYRLDRLIAHITETSQGRHLLFSKLSLLKWLTIFGYVYVVFHDEYGSMYQAAVTLLFVYEVMLIGRDIFLRRIKRPVFTAKAIFLIVFPLAVLTMLYIIGLIQQGYLWLLILDRLTPFVISFFVFSLSFPTILYQDYTIDRAIEKIRQFEKLLVIGITGSYGKSSTKEYTAQILSKKFKVVKTKGTNNTPIGLANTILHTVSKDTEIFVAEMGAYKRGEIAQLCQIAQPKIGVLTAVAYQHLSLFGSPENVAKTKYELIEYLPSDGLALFNGNDSNVQPLYKKTKKKKILYEADYDEKKQKKERADIVAKNIHVEKEFVSFDVIIGKKQFHIKAPVIGKQAVENMLPGIYLAHHLGMSEKQIKEACCDLKPLEKTMMLHRSIQGAYIIDDTFNVNPDGVIAALDYARIYKGKKILVLEPIIELGSSARREHYRVGTMLAKHCDYVFLTKNNYVDEITKGILDQKGTCLVKVARSSEIADFINKHANRGDIVIFEGKESAVALNKIV